MYFCEILKKKKENNVAVGGVAGRQAGRHTLHTGTPSLHRGLELGLSPAQGQCCAVLVTTHVLDGGWNRGRQGCLFPFPLSLYLYLHLPLFPTSLPLLPICMYVHSFLFSVF